MELLLILFCGMAGLGFAQRLPGAYFRLMEAGAAQVEQVLTSEPAANLAALEARPGWKHFPYAILASRRTLCQAASRQSALSRPSDAGLGYRNWRSAGRRGREG